MSEYDLLVQMGTNVLYKQSDSVTNDQIRQVAELAEVVKKLVKRRDAVWDVAL